MTSTTRPRTASAAGAANSKSTAVAVKSDALKARSMAQQFFKEIETLEGEIKQSNALSHEIENRGFWKRLGSSTSKDLAAIGRIQNSINKRMVDLIQETIRLNMLSYAGLVVLMDEMRNGIEHGFRDANGNITRLGEEGRDLAEAATDIISGILDTSRDTQDRIEHNAESIQHLVQRLEETARADAERDAALTELVLRADAKDTLDGWQNEALSLLETQLRENEAQDRRRDAALTEQADALVVQQQALATVQTLLQTHHAGNEARFQALLSAHGRWRNTVTAMLVIAGLWLSALSWQVFLR